ncbi:MAG TPA: hypothetical protein VM577_00655 [Anaerovoracaceae bacterium]|nr:hypothetical protein [Anaerovoracaceae bacterium]
MCVLCLDAFEKEFSVEHMEVIVKKLKQEERVSKASSIKKQIAYLENRDNAEEYASALEHLKNAQYLLSRYL